MHELKVQVPDRVYDYFRALIQSGSPYYIYSDETMDQSISAQLAVIADIAVTQIRTAEQSEELLGPLGSMQQDQNT